MKTRAMMPPAGPQSNIQNPFIPTPDFQIPFGQVPSYQTPNLHTTFANYPLLLPSLLLILGITTQRRLSNLTSILADDDRLQGLLAANLHAIDDMNYDFSKTLHNRQHRESNVEENPEMCKTRHVRDAPSTLSSGFVSLQESILDLQMAVTRRMVRKQPGEDVTQVLDNMLLELESQRKILEGRREEGIRHPRHPQQHLSGCRQPFFVVGDECFYLNPKIKMAWHDANSSCAMMGAHLAEPKNLQALAGILHDFPTQYKRWWVGGSDEAQEGDWRWVSGRPVASDDWRAGQPSNFSMSGEVQDCLALVMLKNQGPPLDDYSCWKKRAFICQMDLEC